MLEPTNRVFDVRNNAYFWPAKLNSFYSSYNDTVTARDNVDVPVYGGGLVSKPLKRILIPPRWLNDYSHWTIDSLAGVLSPNVKVENNFNVDPGFAAGVMNHVDALIAYIHKISTNTLDARRWEYPSATLFPPTWPLPEDLAYSNGALMSAGSDGFPLGDLNWFPGKKAEWEGHIGPTTLSIVSFNPGNGPIGTSVVVSGSNLGPTQGTSTIKFGTVIAEPTYWSNTQIVVPVPIGVSGVVIISVTVNGTIANSATLFAVTPASPTSLAGTNASSTGFTANWSSVTGATSYRMDVATDNGFVSLVSGYSNLDVGNVTSYAVTGLTPNTPYYYRVRAANTGGTSGNSNVVSVTTLPNAPASPLALAGTTIAAAGFTANWSAATEATGYRLDVATDNLFAATLSGFNNLDVGNVTTYGVSGLNPNTPYYYRVRAVNNGGTSANSNVVTVSTLPNHPGTPTTLAATGIGTGTATLNGTFNPNGANTSAWFEWGMDAGLATSSSTTKQDIGAGSITKSITQTIASLNTGQQYYFRVVAQNAAGESRGSILNFSTTLPAYPATFALSNTTLFPSRTSPGDYLTSDYRLFGLPGNSGAAVATLFTGVAEKDWRVSWDNGNPSNYIVRHDASATFTLATGKAFWVLSKGPLTVSATVASAPLNTSQEVEIPLHAGWNVITNPYTQAVSWSRIQTANTTGEPIYSFTGSFAVASTFDPYAGYYYYNTPNASVLKIPYGALFKLSEPPSDPASWRITVAVKSGEASDNTTSFGVASKSELERQTLSYHKPRTIADGVSTSFNRPDLDFQYPEFATDIRPEFDTMQEWSFDFRGKVGEKADISFLGLASVTASQEIWLIDHQRAKASNLRIDSVYTITPATSLCKFTVLVGEQYSIEKRLESVLPTDFSIDRNFPNPFNPSTNISVTVPRDAKVSLRIHDVLGREITTMFVGYLGPGRHWFTWNGTDHTGRAVASGVYFARLQVADGPSFIQKMLMTH